MFVFKAAVVGAGTMGGQIAQTIASAGIPVVLKDVREDLVEAGLTEARKVTQNQVGKLVERGKLNEEAAGVQVAAVVDRIHGTTEYEGFGDVDFAIEAVPERMEIKQAVFSDLDAVTPGHAILASNTSSLSITEIGEATSRPDRVCGFHYFYPAAVMRLVEIVEGDDTSSETLSTAVALAQTIRKMPITCAEVPGFVVNRILNSALSEVWRMQEEQGLSIEKIDAAVTESKTAPMGPFYLGDLLGLDTVLHVAEYLDASYPGRMYVHGGLRELVAAGKLGAKSGGEGFYANGASAVPGDKDPDPGELADRFNLKALVEGCLLVEEGVVSTKDVDLGMMAGAGLMPPPFARADATGLDEVVRKLETAAEEWGERYAPPLLLRRLANQGRTGLKAGQGFFPYKRPDADGFDQGGTVTLETRGDVAIAWLDSPPMNALSPDVVADLRRVWEHVRDGGAVRALVLASANPQVFCAGADIKAFTKLDATTGQEFIGGAHALLRDMERSGVATIAAVNAIAFGGGCEIAMGCDVRIAAQSALFGQPEINLGIMPGLGGTQRLPRLVGTNKALEMNLTGEPISADEAYEFGLVNRVVPDHELLDTALAWARKLAGQAPLSVARIKQVATDPALDAGLDAEAKAFVASLGTEDGREGVAAFLEKREPQWRGA
jgi:enoyl-CoA hydratase/3-hydroxyacyl-CoA dehydrogenase